MTTQCSESKLVFHELDSRQVEARFDGGEITSDAGGILLREIEKRTRILGRMSECFADHRDPERIEHTALWRARAVAPHHVVKGDDEESLVLVEFETSRRPVAHHVRIPVQPYVGHRFVAPLDDERSTDVLRVCPVRHRLGEPLQDAMRSVLAERARAE